MRIAQLPQIAAHQFRLARVHQAVALKVVDEKIAVVAVAESRQDALGFVQRGRIALAGIDQVRDRARGQRHVVLQLGFLAVQVGLLDGGALQLRQRNRLVPHEQGNGAQGQDQRRDRQEDDLLP